MAVPASVKRVYSIIRSAVGALGGAGAGGAIYGEVTMTSFHRLVLYLAETHQLTRRSVFLDIGAGLGKPNLHVAAHMGCASVGVEMIGSRWYRSMAVLRAVLSRAPRHTPPPLFAHADLLDCDLSPFTHLYAFDRGFPPDTLRHMFRRFEASERARVLVCYQTPRRAAELGLTVPACQRFSMKMSGSGEQHSCWVYAKMDQQDSPPGDNDGLQALAGWTLPPVPEGSSDMRSPVPHCASYRQAVVCAVAAMRAAAAGCGAASTPAPAPRVARDRYAAWTVEQMGLHSAERSKRRTRGRL